MSLGVGALPWTSAPRTVSASSGHGGAHVPDDAERGGSPHTDRCAVQPLFTGGRRRRLLARTTRRFRELAAEQAPSDLGRRAVDEVEREFFPFLYDGPTGRRLGQAERRHRDDVRAEPDG